MKPFRYLFLASAVIILIACEPETRNVQYGKATQELMSLVENDPELKSMLVASIEKAHQINPDRNTNPVHNLDEYFEFVTYVETAMPWAFLRKSEYSEIKDNTAAPRA